MDRSLYTTMGVAVLALIAVTTVPLAAASPVPSLAGVIDANGRATVSPARTCYQQAEADNGVGIVSQNFEVEFDDYDSRGADDFEITRACRFSLITVQGTYFNGTGVPTSVNVIVYGSTVRGPGQVELKRLNAPYDDCFVGCLAIKVTGKLPSGRHWLSVQANQDFSNGGEWGWLTNNTVRGSGAMWKNPADGFAAGCTTYTNLRTCIPAGEGGDFAFSIQ